MTDRFYSRLAWTLFALALLTLGLTLWSPDMGLYLMFALITAPFAIVGVMVASRRRSNPIGWLFLVFAVVAAFASFGDRYASYALVEHPGSLSAVSLVLRRATGVERQQFKWFIYAVALVSPSSVLIFGDGRLIVVLLPLVPAAGIAILKHRLYDIDLIVNRTLVYGALTAALIYAGSVVSLQYAFRALTGQTSQLVVVASTLVIAALFSPLRRRIQNVVDRRLYRKKYDARKTLEEFGARLRDETDLDRLNGDLVQVVQETVRPGHVSLWLRAGNYREAEGR